jgi:Zinc knuckle
MNQVARKTRQITQAEIEFIEAEVNELNANAAERVRQGGTFQEFWNARECYNCGQLGHVQGNCAWFINQGEWYSHCVRCSRPDVEDSNNCDCRVLDCNQGNDC